eukprot:6207651-Pleurochrysis_carterae.AAC.1
MTQNCRALAWPPQDGWPGLGWHGGNDGGERESEPGLPGQSTVVGQACCSRQLPEWYSEVRTPQNLFGERGTCRVAFHGTEPCVPHAAVHDSNAF